MNYQAHDNAIHKAAEHIAKLLFASSVKLDDKLEDTNNDFYRAFVTLYWRNYITLGLRNKGAVYYKARELFKLLSEKK